MIDRIQRALSLAAALVLLAMPAASSAENPPGVDVEAVQAMLAVQGLDGWLLYDAKGKNPLALELVSPAPKPTRQWFFFIPASGQPSVLVHKSESLSFEAVAGTKVEYSGYRDLKDGLRKVLKGSRTIAMEYAPKSGIPSLTRVDASTVRLVGSLGMKIQSSAVLVQFTKSNWRPEGRVAHYVAAHHLNKLKNEALEYVTKELAGGRRVTELDVQSMLKLGYRVRGISGDNPVVAVSGNTANPRYLPTERSSRPIKRGDLLMISMSAQVDGAEQPVVSSLTWMAYVGREIPERYAELFKVVAEARDQSLGLIRERIGRRRAIKGFEADQKARSVIGEAGFADRFVHRTGHSLDTGLYGDGANLDDFETHDTRALVMGSGFTIGPGVYVKGDFGIRAEINVFIGRDGVEVTTPSQSEITSIPID